jgi:hypothetical protein
MSKSRIRQPHWPAGVEQDVEHGPANGAHGGLGGGVPVGYMNPRGDLSGLARGVHRERERDWRLVRARRTAAHRERSSSEGEGGQA